ncbi:methyltransferase-like protein 27 isoform X1 [Brachionichthys hirsutus]|uniref:methyltransferase-like protein 27 isoform X2 n=1 Tax=Brachionichthys hirsutus TaxID=412623 RepID=UPI0036045739
MSADKTFANVRANILSSHKSSSLGEKVNFYDSWAENYDADVAALDYRAPGLAARTISTHFSGDHEAAVVLDLACGTGLVAKQLETHGFRHFVGVDGSERMLELAKEGGLYQELKQCLLGEDPIPVQWGLFDVVVIVGALSVGQVPVHVVRELCKAAKAGGYICMTTRGNRDNADYKVALENELKQMEEEELWTCVEVTVEKDWERAVSEHEHGYISGAVYIYKKL